MIDSLTDLALGWWVDWLADILIDLLMHWCVEWLIDLWVGWLLVGMWPMIYNCRLKQEPSSDDVW